MNHFELLNGELACEGVPLAKIAREVGTPVYVYSTATLRRHYQVFRDAFRRHPELGEPLVAYAVKACSNLSVLKTLGNLGAGADTVSEGEIRRALAAGIPAERIIFSGVGKTESEIEFALKTGVLEINVESEPELATVSRVARRLGKRAPVALRINPDVHAGAHDKISTGRADSKFGIAISVAADVYARAANDAHLKVVGIASHIGSQISDLSSLVENAEKMKALVLRLRGEGHTVERLDLGGGLGVPYFNQKEPPSPADYAQVLAPVIKGLNVKLSFEPGRVIAANAGVLVAQVIHVNERPDGRRFLVLDAALNDLIRPAMYEAFHDIRPVHPREGSIAYDVVGPICETGDTFTRDRMLPPFESGDLVAFMSAGAYGAAMSSEYNTRPLVPEVLVHGDRYAVVRPRPTYEEILAREPLAEWL